MSQIRHISLPSWTALAFHQEQKWLHNLNRGLDLDGVSTPVVVDPEFASRHSQLKLVKQFYVLRCVRMMTLVLDRLVRDDNWEEMSCGDDYDDSDSIAASDSSIRAQDISLHNFEVEVSCSCPVGCNGAAQNSTEIHVTSDVCTINGVQMDMEHLQSILDGSKKVEFVGSMKGNYLKKRQFMQSQHQYLRQLGLLFYQMLSRGKSYQSLENNRDEMSSSINDDSNHNDNDLSKCASKLMKKMSLRDNNQELLEAGIPMSICRVVNDLIHSENCDKETAFQSFVDISNELCDIINDRPQILFYSNADASYEGRLEFGNVVYGREAETQQIFDVAASPNELLRNRLVQISGSSGEGKSYLVEGVKNHMVNGIGWVYIGVKFDRLMHNSPLTAVSSAFERFFADLFSSTGQEAYIAAITESLHLFLSPSMILLLCNLIPTLRRLFPALLRRVVSDDDLTSMADESREEPNQVDEILSDPESSRNRLHYSMRRLVHAISSQGRPLLFVVDDLQWGDRPSLDLFTGLLIEWDPLAFEENVPIARTLFIGLYRSEEVDSNHILSTTYFPIFNNASTLEVHTIQLQPMTKEAANSMLSNGLRLPCRITRPLANVVHSKAAGSPFYIRAFLELLAANKTLSYSLTVRQWTWDLEAVKNTPISEKTANLMKRSILTLPKITVQALKLLSCFGSKADEATLVLLSNHIDMIDALAAAIDRSIVEIHGKVYSFAHDILEETAYGLMSHEEQSNNHLLIGSKLADLAIESFHSHSQWNKLFVAADQINRALTLGNSQLSYSTQYANLNLKAAEAALSVSNFSSALSYAEHGLTFLADRQWQEPNYQLTLHLHEAASKACFSSTQSDKLRYVLDNIFEHAMCFEDRLPSFLLLMETLGSMSRFEEAINLAFNILDDLGDTFPKDISPSLIQHEVASTIKTLSVFTDEDIKSQPRLKDQRIQVRIRMMGAAMPSLFNSKPLYIPLLACRIIKLSIEHGFCSDSAFGLVALTIVIPDIATAYRWGKLSITLHESFVCRDKHHRLKLQVYGYLAFFCEPLQACTDVFRNNHRDALLAGDNHYRLLSLNFYIRFSMMCGHSLSDLEKECTSFAKQMTKLGQHESSMTYVGICAVIFELAGSKTNPFTLIPSMQLLSEKDYMDRLVASGQTPHFNDLFLNFWFKKYEDAAESAKQYQCQSDQRQRRFLDVYCVFYEGINAFQLAKKCDSLEDRSTLIATGELSIASFETWAKYSKWNFDNKLRLLKAELRSLTCSRDEAIEEYKASIESAKEHRFVHEQGLAFELLGSLYKRDGNEEQAKKHLALARECYEKWGLHGVIELRTPAEDCFDENVGQS